MFLMGVSALALLVGSATYVSMTFPSVNGPAQRTLARPGLVQSKEYLTPSILVDGIYPSMTGPTNTDLNIKLTEDQGNAELLWATGYRAEMVGPDGQDPRTQEFMCHNSLTVHNSVAEHAQILGSGHVGTRRLFSLAQGQTEMDLPEGFGIPVSSSERLMLQSQLLNMRQERVGSEVRHRVEARFIADRDVDRPMQALSLVFWGIQLEIADDQARDMPDDPLSCAADAGGQRTMQRDGKEFTAHWVVKPGPEKRTMLLRKPFPFDTTVHYIATHMHGYGQWMELRDVTADKTVYKAICKPTATGDGLAEIDVYSSASGFPVYAGHDYEMISYYNNTSKEDVTAMAYFFCYIKDPTFRKPDPAELAARSEEYCKPAPATYRPTSSPGVRAGGGR